MLSYRRLGFQYFGPCALGQFLVRGNLCRGRGSVCYEAAYIARRFPPSCPILRVLKFGSLQPQFI